MSVYSGPTAEDLDRIPADLRTRPQWVLWRGEDRLDTKTGEITGLNKIPMDPQTLHKADTTDPATWGTFAQCVAALPVALEEWEQEDAGAYRGGGIGFVFASDDPYCGIDLDHCRDPDTGMIALWAQAHIDALASYTEVTPSGTGVHVLVQGALPPRGRKKGPVELYTYARFFTMTGWHVAGTPRTIEARQEALYEVHGRVFGPQAITRPDGTITCYCPTCDYLATLMPSGVCPSCSTAPIAPPVVTTGPTPAPAPLLEDTVILDKARAAKNGARFTALWAGDTSAYRNDDSVADMALCIRLAFWTEDPAQLDRLFRQSGLLRAKWDEKRGAQTYGERTIAEALARQTTHYTPAAHLQVSSNGSTAPQQTIDAAEDAKLAADALLALVSMCAEDAKQDAIYDGLPALVPLDTIAWIRLKRQLKACVPALNMNDLERARNDLRRTAAVAAQTSTTPAATPPTGSSPGSGLADIIIGPDITRLVNEAQAALLKLPDAPVIYQRARRLCVIARGVKPPLWLHRPQDTPIILEASPGHLWELAGHAAQWWKLDKRAKKYELALPPRWCIEALQGRDGWPFVCFRSACVTGEASSAYSVPKYIP